MNKKQKGNTSIELIYVIIWLVLVIGWIMNMYKVFTVDWESPFKTEAIRTISVFIAPVGGVIGYMDIGEENKDNESKN